ncbi:Protein YghO [subsurface metagenome]
MGGLEILPVRSSRQRLRFIKMPWSIYRGDSHWVPPLIADQKVFLDPERGVFFDHGEAELFLALREGKSVGRISAQVNFLQDKIYGDDKGFFGFFECENDQETANALFRAGEQFLKNRGKKVIEGPLSFGIYDEIGVLIHGFDCDPYVLTLHNPPYYRDLIEGAGFVKSIDWYAYRGFTDQQVEEKLFRARDRVLQTPGFKLRNVNLKQVRQEAEIIRTLFHSAWDRNWGHVPFTDREFYRLVHEMLKIVIPELSFIAEIDNRPVGFALSIYDANEAVKKTGGRLFPIGFIQLLVNLKRTDRFRHILMGMLEEYRNRGFEIAFYINIAENAYRLGFREVEMSLVVENNVAMRNSLKHLPVEIYKTYRIFKKAI